jgi:hypothetical protein
MLRLVNDPNFVPATPEDLSVMGSLQKLQESNPLKFAEMLEKNEDKQAALENSFYRELLEYDSQGKKKKGVDVGHEKCMGLLKKLTKDK